MLESLEISPHSYNELIQDKRCKNIQVRKKKPSSLNCIRITGRQKNGTRDSLVAQWLRLCALNAGVLGSIPSQGTGIPPHSEAKKFKKNNLKRNETRLLSIPYIIIYSK